MFNLFWYPPSRLTGTIQYQAACQAEQEYEHGITSKKYIATLHEEACRMRDVSVLCLYWGLSVSHAQVQSC